MRPLVTALLLSLLAACGQAGDLYLPAEKPVEVVSPPVTGAEETKEEEKEAK